jgi:hypothetical protein
VEAEAERERERALRRRRIRVWRRPARAPGYLRALGVERLRIELELVVARFAARERERLVLGGGAMRVPADKVLDDGHCGEAREERGGERALGGRGPERLDTLGDDDTERGAEEQAVAEERERGDVRAWRAVRERGCGRGRQAGRAREKVK